MVLPVNISDKAWKAADAYAKKFDQVVVDGDDEEDALEEEAKATVDGAGTSGGAMA